MWQSQFRSGFRILSAALLSTALFSSISCAAPIGDAALSRPLAGLTARAPERVPDDATDYRKVLRWLIRESGVEPKDKLVFYTGTAGQEMAKNFVDANSDYEYFWSVFDDDFSSDFGDVNVQDSDVALACSEALALYAEGETRVFNDPNASETSYWIKEKNILLGREQVTNIYAMEDNTTDEDAYTSDLKADADEDEVEEAEEEASEAEDGAEELLNEDDDQEAYDEENVESPGAGEFTEE